MRRKKTAPTAADADFENERTHASRAPFRLKAGLQAAYPTKVGCRASADLGSLGGVMNNHTTIEPLEPRIAPATITILGKTATWTEPQE